MQADPYWSLAMAVNVFMVFFLTRDPKSFREHLWAYCVFCFGLPAIPAVILLVIAPHNVRVYGNATVCRTAPLLPWFLS